MLPVDGERAHSQSRTPCLYCEIFMKQLIYLALELTEEEATLRRLTLMQLPIIVLQNNGQNALELFTFYHQQLATARGRANYSESSHGLVIGSLFRNLSRDPF